MSAQLLPSCSRAFLSASVSDALLGLSARAPSAVPAPSRLSDALTGAGIPAEKAAWIATLDADNWALRRPVPLDDDTFAQQSLASMSRSGTAKLPGFAEARADGTLSIHRACDLPELGYRSFQVVLYKDGAEFGGVGFTIRNDAYWLDLRRSGTFAATGAVRGNDYVATWPLAWDGDGAQAEAA